jgi:4-amino-4-deoxychorismate lyase
MCRFIETILFENNHMPLLRGHEQRFAQTQLINFGQIIYPSLEKIIFAANIPTPTHIRYKCRVVYDAAGVQVSFAAYAPKKINKLIVKVADEIDYRFKYENRSGLNALTQGLNADEEVLIVQNGLLTETSFTHIALFDGIHWHTPAQPLLQAGVQRNCLLAQNIIREANIPVAHLKKYAQIKLFNALNSWQEAWTLDCNDVIFSAPTV